MLNPCDYNLLGGNIVSTSPINSTILQEIAELQPNSWYVNQDLQNYINANKLV